MSQGHLRLNVGNQFGALLGDAIPLLVGLG
jgi:hypothetical protein